MTGVVLPIRVGLIRAQRRVLLHEDSASSLRVALALAPTLTFTLVPATIVRERFDLPADSYGAPLVYAALGGAGHRVDGREIALAECVRANRVECQRA